MDVVFSMENCYCIDLWINRIMYKRVIVCQGAGKEYITSIGRKITSPPKEWHNISFLEEKHDKGCLTCFKMKL